MIKFTSLISPLNAFNILRFPIRFKLHLFTVALMLDLI